MHVSFSSTKTRGPHNRRQLMYTANQTADWLVQSLFSHLRYSTSPHRDVLTDDPYKISVLRYRAVHYRLDKNRIPQCILNELNPSLFPHSSYLISSLILSSYVCLCLWSGLFRPSHSCCIPRHFPIVYVRLSGGSYSLVNDSVRKTLLPAWNKAAI
jgi:hypothetical protein